MSLTCYLAKVPFQDLWRFSSREEAEACQAELAQDGIVTKLSVEPQHSLCVDSYEAQVGVICQPREYNTYALWKK